eukprot:CAMPEP_0177593200 /NCGR_PEP_ID=MMETSP0419_2-20121207/9005_1 /TAXON_ID=582737 /ORGANISM="Tetraselmis sp., Strain GSL018" /LENGTH=64 /DNA_ID=CAMNT_0019084195 /DNA_START=259 /DNA_END=453 /DNA_ORIENTATION=-
MRELLREAAVGGAMFWPPIDCCASFTTASCACSKSIPVKFGSLLDGAPFCDPSGGLNAVPRPSV